MIQLSHCANFCGGPHFFRGDIRFLKPNIVQAGVFKKVNSLKNHADFLSTFRYIEGISVVNRDAPTHHGN